MRVFSGISLISFLCLLSCIGCYSTGSDPTPAQLVLVKTESISPPLMAVWPGYNVSLPARRQYYTNYEYDQQTRLVRINRYKDNSVYAPYDKRPDELLDSFRFTYDQSDRLSQVIKYVQNGSDPTRPYEQYATFNWSDRQLDFTESTPTIPGLQPYIYCHYVFELDQQGLPIKQTNLQNGQQQLLARDPQGNVLQTTNQYGTVWHKQEFDLRHLAPYSSSYTLLLWYMLVDRGGNVGTSYSRNWITKWLLTGSATDYVLPEQIVESNAEGYPTRTKQKLEAAGLPVFAAEDTLLVRTYSYQTR